MPTWGEWKSLNSEGEIQSDLPSVFFQYRYSILEQILFDESDLDSFQKTINGEWKLQVLTSDVVVFEQEVRQRFDIQYLLMDYLGNVVLGFYSWQAPLASVIPYPVGTDNWTIGIKTTVPSPVVTLGAEQGDFVPGGGIDYTDNTGWIVAASSGGGISYQSVQSATATTPPASPGWGDASAVPAGGSGAWLGHGGELATWVTLFWSFQTPLAGYTVLAQDDGTLYSHNGIQWQLAGVPDSGSDDGYWYSPIYEIAIQPGSKFNVLFHNIGVDAWGNRFLAIQTRTAAGGTFGSLIDVPGYIRLADPSSGRIIQRETISGVTQRRPILRAADSPSMWKDSTNRLFLAAHKTNAYRLYDSYDDGYLWGAVLDGNGSDVVIWEDGYSNYHTAGLGGNLIGSLAGKGGRVWFKSSMDNFITPALVVASSEPYQLVAGNKPGDAIHAVSAGPSGKIMQSNNGGLTWVEVEVVTI